MNAESTESRALATRVVLSVETQLSEDIVTAALGHPTSIRRFDNRSSGRVVTEWSMQLSTDRSSYRAVEQAQARLLALPDVFPVKISGLRAEDADLTVAFLILQDLDDEWGTTGFTLEPGTLRLLAALSGSVVVDQSVYCPPVTDDAELATSFASGPQAERQI